MFFQSSDVSEYCDLTKDLGTCVAGMKSLEMLVRICALKRLPLEYVLLNVLRINTE